jgi:hypothetical protein
MRDKGLRGPFLIPETVRKTIEMVIDTQQPE